jgi:hypothetical protein
MYIFLDESGDLGFDFANKQPSTHFIITLLVFKDHKILPQLKNVIKHTFKHKLNVRSKQLKAICELKGTKTTFATKKYFYEQLTKVLRACNWGLHTIVLNKKQLLAHFTVIPPAHHLYNILSHRVLKQLDFSSVNGKIHLVADLYKASKERKIFNHFLQTNLKAQLPLSADLDIKHEMSNNNAGLQVVDLFCWGIFRKYTSNNCDWYNLFKSQIIKEEEIYKF